jgi:hypothetical protein
VDTDHPALVVKIDNTAGARPQVGLSSADIVVEELVEGGSTRLAALFHSTLPDVIGPVRSIRTSDIGLVQPTNGALVASGGAGRVLRLMDDVGVTVITEGSPGFARASDRKAPYNVMIDPTTVRDESASGIPAPEQNYLPWGDGTPDGERAANVSAQFSNAHTTEWEHDGNTWRRTNGLAADDDQFAATSLLILRVAVRDAGYEDPAGNPVPETVLTGEGEAVLFTGGSAVQCAWSKETDVAALELEEASGDPIAVPPGRTWIELVPEAGSISYG